MAQKSIVLLKNEQNILPLSKSTKTIAVIGPLGKSKRDLEGGWIPLSDTTLVTSVYDGLSQKLGAGTKLIYARGCNIEGDSEAGFAEAIQTAKQADVVVMALGESWDMSGTYSDLKLSDKKFASTTGSVDLSFTLTNTGNVAGEEVAQLYIQDEVASVARPLKELKDFKKVFLKPGESKTITFKISRDKLSFYNRQLKRVAEPGTFKVTEIKSNAK